MRHPGILQTDVTQPFFIDLVSLDRRSPSRSSRRTLACSGLVADGLSVETVSEAAVWSSITWCGTSIRRARRRPAGCGDRAFRDPLLPLRPHDGGKGPRGVGRQRSRGRRRRAPARRANHRPSNALLALNGYNYWAPTDDNPCSVLGMVYALEVIASVYGGPIASPSGNRCSSKATAASRSSASHATMDAEHMADLRLILNKVVRQ